MLKHRIMDFDDWRIFCYICDYRMWIVPFGNVYHNVDVLTMSSSSLSSSNLLTLAEFLWFWAVTKRTDTCPWSNGLIDATLWWVVCNIIDSFWSHTFRYSIMILEWINVCKAFLTHCKWLLLRTILNLLSTSIYQYLIL